jgi:UDP-glucuronate 4-epimerase
LKRILVTGAAGFIGFSIIKSLIGQYKIIGIDNLNEYYDIQLKKDRLKELGVCSAKIEENKEYISDNSSFTFIKQDFSDKDTLRNLFAKYTFETVIHLGAQAGVRYSFINPESYITSNIIGTNNIFEICSQNNVKHVLFASSSSVYGKNKKQPYSEADEINKPMSLYASTKISGESLAHYYAETLNLKITALRFFSVYGPWGRPDMAYWLFAEKILNNQPIQVFNNGKLARDFTYIDDIISGIQLLLTNEEKLKNKFSIFNIGRGEKVKLTEFIESLEKILNKEAIKEYKPMQKGDVFETFADITKLKTPLVMIRKLL